MATIQDMMRKIKKIGNEIESLSGKTATILADHNGMIDRQCPSCKNQFMVDDSDWDRVIDQAHCPSCGQCSTKSDFTTDEHRKVIKESIEKALMNNWKNNLSIQDSIVKVESTLNLPDSLKCEICTATFSSVQPVQYCPCCGTTQYKGLPGNLFGK